MNAGARNAIIWYLYDLYCKPEADECLDSLETVN